MRHILILLACLLWPLSLAGQTGQDEDRGFVAGLLETALGGEGRIVRITGFAGALSRTATIDRISIADRQGIWLTLEDVALTWNRGALLRGAIDIAQLRAARIDLPRLPVAETGINLPDAEAKPFSLPDLPASIRIGQLAIDTVALGAPVLGEPATFAVTGSATLAGGAGDTELMAQRIDGPRASFRIEASHANDSRTLSLDMAVSEAANGLLSGLLNLPGRPSVDFDLRGDGPLDGFAATLDLRTDGAPRLAGTLALQGEADGPTAFDADLKGDVTAVFLPKYAAFFGPEMSLNAQGRQDPSGALNLEAFALETRALRMGGQLALDSDGWPTRLDIKGRIADPDGGSVLLPAGAGETRVDLVDLTVTYDASRGDALAGALSIAGLDRADMQARSVLLGVNGTLRGAVNTMGERAARIDLDASGLGFADPGLSQAIGTALRGGFDMRLGDDAPLRLGNLSLGGGAWTLTGDAVVQSLSRDFTTSFDVALDTPDLSAFADLAGFALEGAGNVTATGSAALGGFFDLKLTGTTENLALGIARTDALLEGVTNVDLAARRNETGTFLDRLNLNNAALSADVTARLRTGASEARFSLGLDDAGRVVDMVSGPLRADGTARQSGGVWDVAAALSGPLDATASVTATIAADGMDVDLTASLPDLNPLVAQLNGAVQITANAMQRDGAWNFDTTLQGPLDSGATVSGRFAGGALSAGYTASLPEISALAPGLKGAASLDGTVRQLADGWQIATDVSGPYASAGTVSGTYRAGRIATAFELAMPSVAPLVPGVPGPLAVTGTLARTDDGWSLASDIQGPYASTATVSGTFGDAGATARYAVQVPNAGALVPRLSGAAALTGTAKQVQGGFDIDARLDGPAGTGARVNGLVTTGGRLELDASGQAQLGLINPFIAPRTVAGRADFELTVDGPPALSSVSGQITTQGTRLAAPRLPLSIGDLGGSVRLGGGQALVDLTGRIAEGGVLGLSGPVTLGNGFPARLALALDNVVVSDNVVYSGTVSGDISLDGALTGGARLAGTINVGQTTLQVPSSTVSTLGSIPDITHIGATRPVMRTRERAGLVRNAQAGGNGRVVAYPLDITINAPSRIFVRGRGIDAELGGSLRLSGTSADAISTGRIDLIRGRLALLGKRFELDEGLIDLQGRFDLFLRLVAATTTATGTARIVVEGAVDDPTVTFEATPAAPQDQVLAQIFFGREITQLTAFQALQLANAVATLAGRGGQGIISRLRGSFALDDLDVAAGEEGGTALRAGKYLSDNVYSDVTLGGASGPEVSLNIDLTPNITVRGSVAADSDTGLGIFIEKDY